MARVIWISAFFLVALTAQILHGQSERWIYQRNSQGGVLDIANDIVSDGGPSLYAAGALAEGDTFIEIGSRFTIVSTDTAGRERWVYKFDHPGMKLDAAYSIVYGGDDNIYAAGYFYNLTGYDYVVVSINTSGGQRWSYTYSGVFGWDMARSVVYGKDDRIYAAGYSQGEGNRHMRVVCLDTNGSERWKYKFNRPDGPNWWDEAYSIVYGDDDNLYVAGYSGGDNYGNQRMMDFAVVSVDTTGQERWFYLYNGPADKQDKADEVIFGNDGYIYAVGFSRDASNKSDILVVSLTSTGQERWIYRFNDPSGKSDRAYSIVQGSDGNLYLAGYSDGETDITVISLDTEGQERWVYTYGGTINLNDKTADILYGREGSVYFAGYSGFHVAAVRLGTDGTEEWVYRHTSGGAPEMATSIVDGSGGNIYLAGWINDETGEDTFGIINLGTEPVGLRNPRDDGSNPVPSTLALSNAPNPFNPSTTISCSLPDDSKTTPCRLTIYNLRGRTIRTLVAEDRGPGQYQVHWDGRDDHGNAVASGIYLYRLKYGEETLTRKMTLVR